VNRLSIAIPMMFLLASLAQAQTEECPALREMVYAALPATVGDADVLGRLLTPQTGPQLSDQFDPKRAEKHVRDNLKPEDCCTNYKRGDRTWSCLLESREGSAFRVELGRGRLIYLNRERSGAEIPTPVQREQALALGRKTAEAFGLPMNEVAPTQIVRYTRVSAGDTEGRMGESYLAEAHVFFRREVGGVPVAWSRFHTAVDARGEVARVHVRWPDLRIADGVRGGDALSRDAVAMSIIDTLETNQLCGRAKAVAARVAYVATSHILGGDFGDADEAGGPPPDDGVPPEPVHPPEPVVEYLPALLVRIYPVEQPEDSGILQEPIEEIAFPLFQTSEEAVR
jgi:hypothetical protein